MSSVYENELMPMAVRSKAYVGNLSISWIAGSNPANDIDICLLC